MPRITMVLLSYTISIKEKRLYAEQKKNAKIVVLPIRKCPLYTRTVKQYGITVNAIARQTSDGFVVLRGSSISPQDDSTVSAGIRERRKSAQVDENYVLLEDVLLASPSGAAMFVIGKSANGWTSWKTQDGKTLHDLESNQ